MSYWLYNRYVIIYNDKMAKLKKNFYEFIEKEKVMVVQIDVIGKEKMVKEFEFERLMNEKVLVEKQMEMFYV